MDLNEYQTLASVTVAPLPSIEQEAFHAVAGLVGEVGEYADVLKKEYIYGGINPYLVQDAREELGDILWYVALAASIHGLSLEEVAQKNIEKLKRRYPGKFTPEWAALRMDKLAETRGPKDAEAEKKDD